MVFVFIKHHLYRFWTIGKSFTFLYTLSEEKVDAFIDAYSIYDYDWKDTDLLTSKFGSNYYDVIKAKLVDWYSVINHLCALGEVEKMYIPPLMDENVGILQNQILFEEILAKDLNLNSNKSFLDIGCGRGKIAIHITQLTEARCDGINLDPGQLENARNYAKYIGLENKCTFMVDDMNNIPLPIPDEQYDAIYQIQAFSLSKDLSALFKDIYRLLKPDGIFACLDWVSLPNYCEDNQKHYNLMKAVKPLVGAIGTPTVPEYISLLKQAGFKIKLATNLSKGGFQAPLIDKADIFFNKVFWIIKFLVKLYILPKHFTRLLKRLTQDGACFVEADRLGLLTTSYYIVAQK